MKHKKTYNFFFDESSHDRKVTNTQKGINIYMEGNNDLFLGVFWGIDSRFEKEYENKYLEFETYGKKLLGLAEELELKGTNIKKSNFKYGFSSFNKNALDIYSRMFDLIDNNVILHINLFSKTEFLITHYFKQIILPQYMNISYPPLIYSIIKFLFNYRNTELLQKMFSENIESTEEFLYELIEMLKEVIKKIKHVPRKKIELPVLKNLLSILEESVVIPSPQNKYNWDYQPLFDGFKFLTEEFSIKSNRINLTLDKEGTGKILETAKKQGFKKVINGDSELVAGIRLSDFLSNFFNRLSYALYESLKEQKFNDSNSFDYETKHVLDSNWFVFKTEKPFLLYKKLYNILAERKNIYWTGFSGVFFDYQLILFSLINYIGGEFIDLNSFKKHSPESHVDRFNNYCLQNIQNQFNKFYSISNSF
ncbi:hypothetical protein [Neobacillus rhizophilus]|uniref:DUF3800 domain-containing protein n=1 Tax=Neobacillus rhizophilus TaxID=2833579 RepID=A0A942TZC8_9BACI|nr:hypothetical protein [Neobacillus rhizophilus]MBS4211611.1 hypothetical protein [Neobacillus rhizophilus]